MNLAWLLIDVLWLPGVIGFAVVVTRQALKPSRPKRQVRELRRKWSVPGVDSAYGRGNRR